MQRARSYRVSGTNCRLGGLNPNAESFSVTVKATDAEGAREAARAARYAAGYEHVHCRLVELAENHCGTETALDQLRACRAADA